MTNTTHGGSKIKTLRLALRPGASAIPQLAAAMAGRGRAGAISVAGFFFPYCPGFPVLVSAGRKPQAPAFPRRPSFR
jgi:hypothetical protein